MSSSISTICVRGLPDNVTRREFRNFLAFLPKFEDSSISGGDGRGRPTGFAKFADADAAVEAQKKLQGYIFDMSEPDRPLDIDIAKRDLECRPYIPPRPPPNVRQIQQQYQYQPAIFEMQMPVSQMSPISQMSPMSQIGHMGHLGRLEMGMMGGGGGGGGMMNTSDQYSRKRSRFDGPQAEGNGDTLCIRKIREGTPEDEIRGLVTNLRGYQHLNIVRQAAGPVLFALFKDAECARGAMRSLQHAELGGQQISVEIARRSLQL